MPAPQIGVTDVGGALGGRCLATTACRPSAGWRAHVRDIPHQGLDAVSDGQDWPGSLLGLLRKTSGSLFGRRTRP
jgi:hypothetical protein